MDVMRVGNMFALGKMDAVGMGDIHYRCMYLEIRVVRVRHGAFGSSLFVSFLIFNFPFIFENTVIK